MPRSLTKLDAASPAAVWVAPRSESRSSNCCFKAPARSDSAFARPSQRARRSSNVSIRSGASAISRIGFRVASARFASALRRFASFRSRRRRSIWRAFSVASRSIAMNGSTNACASTFRSNLESVAIPYSSSETPVATAPICRFSFDSSSLITAIRAERSSAFDLVAPRRAASSAVSVRFSELMNHHHLAIAA